MERKKQIQSLSRSTTFYSQSNGKTLHSASGKLNLGRYLSSSKLNASSSELQTLRKKGGRQKKLVKLSIDAVKPTSGGYKGFPSSIPYIICNEFCERFNFYGLRTVLVLYLTLKLKYDEEISTMLFHTFTTLVYLFPLVGAIIADTVLGKYRTILYLSIIYALGGILLSLSAVPLLGEYISTDILTIVGLIMIAIGTGGIKPCVSAFGGDQFELPEQAEELATFFALFYFAINAGSTLSTTITPILRADIQCFGENDCFPLAFGVPACLMLISVLIFASGRNKYKKLPTQGNMIFGIAECICAAIIGWVHNRKTNPCENFLDYAKFSASEKIVNETQMLMKILMLYLPLPVFWALFDQQGSRWVFQATRMDGSVAGFVIKPDQMQVVGPLLILIFIPIFDYVLYPLLHKCGIKQPLQKIILGGLLAAIAFVCAALVEIQISRTEPEQLSKMTAELRFYNGMPCNFQISLLGLRSGTTSIIEPLGMWSNAWTNVVKPKTYQIIANSNLTKCPTIEGVITLVPGEVSSYFIANNKLHKFKDDHGKHVLGQPLVRTLINTKAGEGPLVLKDARQVCIDLNRRALSRVSSVAQGINQIAVNGVSAAEFKTRAGGVYTVMLHGSLANGYQSNLLEVIPPNTVSILWQLPQIFIITAAEILFSVTGLEFSFTQAPISMKSVLQACWLLSVATGNILVVIIAKFSVFKSRSAEFLLFANLMLVDMIFFTWLSKNYEYSNKFDFFG